VGPRIEKLNTTIPTITLFHTVPIERIGNRKVEMISQTPLAVLTYRAAGTEIAMSAATAMITPTSHVFVNWAPLWGHRNAEMNNQAPAAALRNLAWF
jgi:hypothetical protein